jgi:hypothetical protein
LPTELWCEKLEVVCPLLYLCVSGIGQGTVLSGSWKGLAALGKKPAELVAVISALAVQDMGRPPWGLRLLSESPLLVICGVIIKVGCMTCISITAAVRAGGSNVGWSVSSFGIRADKFPERIAGLFLSCIVAS